MAPAYRPIGANPNFLDGFAIVSGTLDEFQCRHPSIEKKLAAILFLSARSLRLVVLGQEDGIGAHLGHGSSIGNRNCAISWSRDRESGAIFGRLYDIGDF